MVTWIPSIYPSHVSIIIPAPWIISGWWFQTWLLFSIIYGNNSSQLTNIMDPFMGIVNSGYPCPPGKAIGLLGDLSTGWDDQRVPFFSPFFGKIGEMNTLWLCQHSYWKLPTFFVRFLIKNNGGFSIVMLVYQRISLTKLQELLRCSILQLLEAACCGLIINIAANMEFVIKNMAGSKMWLFLNSSVLWLRQSPLKPLKPDVGSILNVG